MRWSPVSVFGVVLFVMVLLDLLIDAKVISVN